MTGLEVSCTRNVSVDVYLELERASNESRLSDMYQKFGDEFLVRWNYVDKDGHALEPTGESFRSIPADIANLIVTTWLVAVAGPSAPLERPSSNGATQSQVVESPLDLGTMSTPN